MSDQTSENEPIEFRKVYYVKLGKNGKWEKSSIEGNKLRIGWEEIALDDINNRDWDKVEAGIKREYNYPKGADTRDLNALKMVVESTSEDIWITFYKDRMWWCRVGEPVVLKDGISKYRELQSPWCDHHSGGKPLKISALPGRISKTAGFRATICRVEEAEIMHRLLNNQLSRASEVISAARKDLERAVIDGIRQLHWRDFEILVDLIFRGAGWRRVTGLGGNQKYTDMDLVEPIMKDEYQVQVKSSATLNDFKEYAAKFAVSHFRKFFFVVHTPSDDLVGCMHDPESGVVLILPERLAQMVVDFGLVDWIHEKVR